MLTRTHGEYFAVTSNMHADMQSPPPGRVCGVSDPALFPHMQRESDCLPDSLISLTQAFCIDHNKIHRRSTNGFWSQGRQAYEYINKYQCNLYSYFGFLFSCFGKAKGKLFESPIHSTSVLWPIFSSGDSHTTLLWLLLWVFLFSPTSLWRSKVYITALRVDPVLLRVLCTVKPPG